MVPPGDARSRFSWVPWIAIAIYAAICLACCVESRWRPEWDGATYLLTARALAEGAGYTYQGEPFFLRPPGLPWMLSWLIGDDGAFDPWTVHALLIGWAVAAVGAIYASLRGPEGRPIALALALLVATSLPFGQMFNWVFAEYPFAALLFAGLGLLEASRRPIARWWWFSLAGALCLAVAIYVRTVGVLLLPGVWLVQWARDRGRLSWRGALPVAVVVLLTWPWWSFAGAASAAAEVPIEQDLLYDYSTALLRVDPGDPGSDFVGWSVLFERALTNGAQLASDFTRAVLHVPAPPASSVLFALLVLAGLGLRLRRLGPTLFDWLFVTYVALILTYFAYDRRLLLPLAPLVYLYLFELVRSVVRGPLREAAWARSAVTVFLVSLLGLNGFALRRNLLEQRAFDRSIEQVARQVRELTPEGSRLLCNQAPILALLTGRTAYTYRFPRSSNLIDKYAIDYVVVDSGRLPASVREETERRGLQAWTLRKPGGRARLVRVR